ncbi:MAG: IS1595 family transposase [Xanthobacteraceae bacterium]|nr:MAG: IS1595 family transposase [Xanthobacteraceae bacterium]
MAKSILSDARFHNEEAAFAYVEEQLWPQGPVCPHCGNVDGAKIGRLQGKTTRAGLRKCYACRKPFTVRIGTIFEDSHLPLRLWLQAIHLLCSSKKGISTRQLQRTLGCGMKTAWHLGHRIRLAMTPTMDAQLGGAGKVVEADETAITNSRKTKRGPGRKRPKHIVMSLVERGGDIRSVIMDHRSAMSHVRTHVHKDSRLVTDQAQHYKFPPVAQHDAVDHSKYEWVRDDVHTNTLEGFFSVLKRGLIGTYQHVGKKHLNRYLAEFDFRQNTRVRLGIDDVERTKITIRGMLGKRLTYRDSSVSDAHE